MSVQSIVGSKRRIGLLLVHGIGQQLPGEFLSQFLGGFRLLTGRDNVEEISRTDPLEGDRKIHTAWVELKDRTIFLYAVHWADVISDDLAFPALCTDLTLMQLPCSERLASRNLRN